MLSDGNINIFPNKTGPWWSSGSIQGLVIYFLDWRSSEKNALANISNLKVYGVPIRLLRNHAASNFGEGEQETLHGN